MHIDFLEARWSGHGTTDGSIQRDVGMVVRNKQVQLAGAVCMVWTCAHCLWLQGLHSLLCVKHANCCVLGKPATLQP